MNYEIYVEILMPMRKISCSQAFRLENIDEIIFKNLIQGDKDKY